MKRIIKFRGKRLDNNKWHYGFYFTDNPSEKYGHFIKDGDHIEEVKPRTIGQFTGFYKKIYD
jgi:hypothetical protein